MRITASYSYQDPEWKDFVIQTFSGPVDYSGNAPTGVPSALFALSIDHTLSDWMDLRVNYERYGDYYYTVDNRFRDGGYQLLGVSARVQPLTWKHWTADLTLLNALDEQYYFYFGGRTAPTYAVPGPPRQLRLSLSARF
jgi:outer membrane receptor protein involved in Fe transport